MGKTGLERLISDGVWRQAGSQSDEDPSIISRMAVSERGGPYFAAGVRRTAAPWAAAAGGRVRRAWWVSRRASE